MELEHSIKLKAQPVSAHDEFFFGEQLAFVLELPSAPCDFQKGLSLKPSGSCCVPQDVQQLLVEDLCRKRDNDLPGLPTPSRHRVPWVSRSSRGFADSGIAFSAFADRPKHRLGVLA